MYSNCDCLVVTFVLYLRLLQSVNDNNDNRNLADLFLTSVIKNYFSHKMHCTTLFS